MSSIKTLKKVKDEFDKLLGQADVLVSSEESCASIERSLLRSLLNIGKLLLQYIIEMKSEELKGKEPLEGKLGKLKNKGKSVRKYLSLFGTLEISRVGYWQVGLGKYYPLDEDLELSSTHHWSYALRELVSETASEQDYRASVQILNKLLGLKLTGKSSSRNAEATGIWVDKYYAEQKNCSEVAEGSCFSLSVDGKGVPMIPKERDKLPKKGKRLGKGEKNGIKKMATVVVSSSFTPKRRTSNAIIKGLMNSPLSKIEAESLKDNNDKGENDNRWHKGIHARAFLGEQKKAIDYGLKNIKRRMTAASQFVVPIDAGVGLEPHIIQSVKEHGLEQQFQGIILDIIHVSEYVWEVANSVLGEKSKLRHRWVCDVLKDILNSNTQKVIDDFRRIRDKTKISSNAEKKITKAITYFSNHIHKMDYKHYIDKGFPVSSALVEAKCGHLVKDRMELSGMRWSHKGAQAILDLRAVSINGHIEHFMQAVPKFERKNFIRKAA